MKKFNKKEAKQKLFEIFENYNNGILTINDVKILTEIIVYHNPYLNSSYDVAIKYVDMKTIGHRSSTNAVHSPDENIIYINQEYLAEHVNSINIPSMKNTVSLAEYINTIFQELRHNDQHFNQKLYLI